MRSLWSIISGKTKEEIIGDKIFNCMKVDNINKAIELINKSNGFKFSGDENLFLHALLINESPELALSIIKKHPELSDQESLGLVVGLPLSYDLIEEICEINKKRYPKEYRKIASMALFDCARDNEYLYKLVKHGANINTEIEGDPFIIWLAKEFVRRDVSHSFKQLNKSNTEKELSHEFIKSMIRTAFNLKANKNAVSKDGNSIIDIIAKGYDQEINDSMIVIHEKKYKPMINFLVESEVPKNLNVKLNNTKREEFISILYAKKEKEVLSHTMEMDKLSPVVKRNRL
jgi:hypothetical protein